MGLEGRGDRDGEGYRDRDRDGELCGFSYEFDAVREPKNGNVLILKKNYTVFSSNIATIKFSRNHKSCTVSFSPFHSSFIVLK